jgi:hypothetical protein
MLEFSTIIRQSQSFPPVFKINLASICTGFQKRLFHIQIRLFAAGEVEPYVKSTPRIIFVTVYTGHNFEYISPIRQSLRGRLFMLCNCWPNEHELISALNLS